MGMGEDWVTIGQFSTPVEAHVAAGALTAAGIRSQILDEHTIGVNPFYSLALGGVRLLVARSRATEAVRVLRPRPFSVDDDPSSAR
jgi:hypothetical protein